jgi:hypothetical protein
MVTRLEGVDAGGHPVETQQRWQNMENSTYALAGFSIRDYLLALFRQRIGFFRVFVFIVSSNALVLDPNAKATPEVVREWQNRGRATLPDSVSNRPFSPTYKVNILLYQFTRAEGHSPELVSDSTVNDQFHATGIDFR